MQELFATHSNAFCALEVIVSAVVVLRFIRTESGRLGINHRLARIAGTLLVGVSLGQALFLYLRELQLERTRVEAAS